MQASRKRITNALKENVDLLEQEERKLDSFAYAALLRQCTHARSVTDGRRVHAHMLKNGYNESTFLGNLLVQMYGQCSNLAEACNVYYKLYDHNVFSWTIMLAAYAQNGQLSNAKDMFDRMPMRDVVTWNAMISFYALAGEKKASLDLFRRMNLEGVNPTDESFLSIADSCPNLADAKLIHTNVVESGAERSVAVVNAVVTMYGKCQSVVDARAVFEKMWMRDLVSWNALMTAYIRNGQGREALAIFQRMNAEGIKLNAVTMVICLEACTLLFITGCIGGLTEGKAIHEHINRSNFSKEMVVGTSLINMYGKCSSINEARDVFDKMHQQDVVSWTAMVTAYAHNGYCNEALLLFRTMDLEGVQPNETTMSVILDVCGTLSYPIDETLHVSCIFLKNIVVLTALLNLYAKCGCLQEAKNVFDQMAQRTLASWNAMITAYGRSGQWLEVLMLARNIELHGISPDNITLLSVLSACSHAGLLADACHYFARVTRDYEVVVDMEHYGCMVDILGRVGKLDEAEVLIQQVPSLDTKTGVWMTLLGACRVHTDAGRGARAAQQVFALEPDRAAPYDLLLNTHRTS